MSEIDDALERAERALAEDRSLKGTGFWTAVDEARRDHAIADRYADRMAAIDRRAFERGVRARLPEGPGVALLFLTAAFGGVCTRFGVASATGGCASPSRGCFYLHIGVPRPVSIAAFLVGFGALLIGTHSLTHYVVGRLMGMRFTHVFLGGPPPPRPGVKVDYATYLRCMPPQRALMHASGAVLTKFVPFVLAPSAKSIAGWLFWLLIAIGVIQIVTDVFLSTKVSDWKKVKRELRTRAERS